MAKWMTGGVVAVAVWMGSAMAAEAQGINVTTTGPMCVYHNQTQTTVTGVANTTGAISYNIQIKLNGVIKYDKNFMGLAPNISKTVSTIGTWGMQAGQSFDTKITVTSPAPGGSGLLSITITQGITKLLPDAGRPSRAPAARREEEFAWVMSNDEELVA